MEKKTVLIIFGGYSTEYYVSCKSAGGILEYIDKDKFNVIKVGVTIDGKWIYTEAEPEEIADGITWIKNKENKSALISPKRNENNLIVLDNKGSMKIHIDCVFPVIHGHGGEDGSIQGLLEICNISYVGSNVAASANSMDKYLTRTFAENCNLKQPKCIVLRINEYNESEIEKRIDFDYPIYVKPASLGSSVGITKVDMPSELNDAIKVAFRYEDKILIEEGIVGSEIKVAILGNENLKVGAVCELKVPEDSINDYATKYIKCSSTKKIPADISQELESKVKEQACLIYKELNCSGFARVDFFLSKDNEVYFNEINTVPGISKTSIFTMMFEEVGISYKEIITNLIELSFQKNGQVSEINNDSFKSII